MAHGVPERPAVARSPLPSVLRIRGRRIVAGPALDYNVTQVSGTTPLAAPVIQCGSSKQVSLRGTGVEVFTIYPPHAMSLEGQWCNNTITSGTAPPSAHRMTVVER